MTLRAGLTAGNNKGLPHAEPQSRRAAEVNGDFSEGEG
jgi:hypothetical protein